MHPEQYYIQDHIDLYEHIDDPVWLKKTEAFEIWHELPIDLPGRRLSLQAIACPLYLLVGEGGDITPREHWSEIARWVAAQSEKPETPGAAG